MVYVMLPLPHDRAAIAKTSVLIGLVRKPQIWPIEVFYMQLNDFVPKCGRRARIRWKMDVVKNLCFCPNKKRKHILI